MTPKGHFQKKNYLCIYFKGKAKHAREIDKEKQREAEIFHLLVHFLNVCNRHGCARPSPDVWFLNFPHGWQEPKHLSHCQLHSRMPVNKKPELEVPPMWQSQTEFAASVSLKSLKAGIKCQNKNKHHFHYQSCRYCLGLSLYCTNEGAR